VWSSFPILFALAKLRFFFLARDPPTQTFPRVKIYRCAPQAPACLQCPVCLSLPTPIFLPHFLDLRLCALPRHRTRLGVCPGFFPQPSGGHSSTTHGLLQTLHPCLAYPITYAPSFFTPPGRPPVSAAGFPTLSARRLPVHSQPIRCVRLSEPSPCQFPPCLEKGHPSAPFTRSLPPQDLVETDASYVWIAGLALDGVSSPPEHFSLVPEDGGCFFFVFFFQSKYLSFPPAVDRSGPGDPMMQPNSPPLPIAGHFDKFPPMTVLGPPDHPEVFFGLPFSCAFFSAR